MAPKVLKPETVEKAGVRIKPLRAGRDEGRLLKVLAARLCDWRGCGCKSGVIVLDKALICAV